MSASSSGPRASAGGWSLIPLLRVGCLSLIGATGCADRSSAPGSSSSAAAEENLPKFDEQMIPSIEVPRLSAEEAAAIVIDGKLDDAVWDKAARTGRFVDVGSGKPRKEAPVGGEARLLYSDEALFIAFEVKNKDVRGGFPADAVDPHLWEKDTVEMMLKPTDDGTNKDYYELQINPQNLVFDSHFDDYNLPKGGPAGPFGHQDFKATMKSAVVVHGTIDDSTDQDEGFTVEAKIDWTSFGGVERFKGHTARMNFYAMKNNGGAAWSPILGEGNFHKAKRFGRVRFAP